MIRSDQLVVPPPYVRIPHLVPGRGTADDRVLTTEERDELLAGEIVVEEKLDGANVMSWLAGGTVIASGRSGPGGGDRAGQFGALRAWVAIHSDRLVDLLRPNAVLYGEWLFLAHTLAYDRLPDLFVGLDIWSPESAFLSYEESRQRFRDAGVVVPPELGRGRFTVEELQAFTVRSAYRAGAAEGVVVRALAPGRVRLAKLVRKEFTPISDECWSRGRPRNRLARIGGAAG